MTKGWKRRAKLVATSIVIAGYLTIGLYNAAISSGGERKKEEAATATVKTIVGYSMEFRMREEMMAEEIACDGGRLPEGAAAPGWQRDDKFNMAAFSAYYDVRLEPYRYVRVVGLLPRNATLYCQVWYGEQSITRKALVHEIWSSGWGGATCDGAFPSLVSCPAPVRDEYRNRTPTRVSFVDRTCARSSVSLPVEYLRGEENSFVVCVKALNYTDRVNDESLAEWIELNARLGAGKIVVYVTHLERVDLDILESYRERKVVEVRRFEPIARPGCPPRSYEDQLWLKRKMEVVAYNDCFYRNVHDAKFVIPLDIDEMIVPKVGNNWQEAFESHFGGERADRGWPRAIDEYSSFSVRNVYFFARYPGEVVLRNLMLPNGGGSASERRKLVTALKRQRSLGPRDSIFRRTVRSSNFSPESDSTKSFVHVPKTLSVFNHYAFHVLGEASRQYIFPEKVLQLNHYRSECDPLLIDGCRDFLAHLTVDDSLERFRNEIPTVRA